MRPLRLRARAPWAFFGDHFEALLYGSFWTSASILGVWAGRPWLGAVGLASVLPFLVAYVRRQAAARHRDD